MVAPFLSTTPSSVPLPHFPLEPLVPSSGPLLYDAFVAVQLQKMSALEGLTGVPLPPELAQRESDKTVVEDDGESGTRRPHVRISSACFSSKQFRKIRMTYFDSGAKGFEVFNSLWYPSFSLGADIPPPLLGVDLIKLSDSKYLQVIDAQPLTSPPQDTESAPAYRSFFERLRRSRDRNYVGLTGRMSARHYDEKRYFSSSMLYGRFEDASHVAALLFPAFCEYLSTYLDMVGSLRPCSSTSVVERNEAMQRGYDEYSAVRDPVQPVLAAFFGHEWAERYVHDFLFDLSSSTSREAREAVEG
ncbi:unnamed protein product [Vitrella brassicaformis CCMP3155]|uniref:15,16-dihydrobiliverdin:ferredoxin oxidoreductase n=2 Tax=Vitrella brassicaformis TaxID=1169539 RepID=A0A0G4H004_VITBC|nr:unnamed protein product [Vitrella brassicaformis CCMP3155]|eukprot:CEM36877.1 unnamed protein product [Vitrella brassicaformis CCMP3155]